MKTPTLLRYLACLGGLLLAACRHTADPDPNPGGCQLTYNDGHDVTYLYSAAGQLTAIRTTYGVFGSTPYTYTYAGSQATITVVYGKDNTHLDDYVLTLNAQGYVTQAVDTYPNGPPQVKERCTFGYDADGHLTSYREDAFTLGRPTPPVRSKRIRLDYQNGDLTQLFDSVSNTTITLRYGAQANRLRLPLLVEDLNIHLLDINTGLLPLAGKPTTHLVSSSHATQPNNPSVFDAAFTYTLDGNGQVTQVRRDQVNLTYTFSSTCY